MGRLDSELLDTSVIRHASGVRVLAQSGKAEEAEGVRPADLVAMLDFLRRHYGYLVIDGIAGFDELSLAVLDASQQIIMVLTQDVPSVRSTKRCLDLFRRLGYDDRKIKLVLNRYQRTSKISPQVISEAVGLPVAHTVSNDFGSAIDSINRGLTLQEVAPRSALTRDIEAMPSLLAGQARNDEQKRGFFRGLLSRKGGGGGTPRAA
jgi:pilus assembly protein CpaE